MRRWLFALISGGSLVIGMLVWAPAATAAPDLVARMTLTTTNTSPLWPRTGEWDELNSTARIDRARADELAVTVSGGTVSESITVHIRWYDGYRFQVGHTVNRGLHETADLSSDVKSCGSLYWFDIRHLAYAGDEITRLDLRFMTDCGGAVLGDLQIGPRGDGVVTGTQSLLWPDTPIGTHHALPAPIWIRNLGPNPVVLGQLQRSGAQVAEFPLLSDRCSGRTLRPRDGCLVEVGFAPITPGAKSVGLMLAAGARSVRVDLAGSAPTGRSTWEVHRPQLRDGTPAADYLFTDAYTPTFAAGGTDSVELEFSFGSWDWSLWLRTKDVAGLKLGTQKFGYDPDNPQQPELNIWGNDLSCASGSGTMNLKQLEFGPDREVRRFSISIRRTCIEDPTPVLAEISYRAADPAPIPSGPSVLRSGQVIRSGGALRTTDGTSFEQRLTLRGNGQAVITDKSGQTVWTSPNRGWGRSYRLGVLADGSVAITDSAGRAVWRQAPAGIRPGDFLLLQGDGNLVLYTPDYHPLWSALPI